MIPYTLMVNSEQKPLKVYTIIALIVSVILIIVLAGFLIGWNLLNISYIIFYIFTIGFTIYSLIMFIYSLAKNKRYLFYTVITSILTFIGVILSLTIELGQVGFILWQFFTYLLIFFYSLYMLWRKK